MATMAGVIATPQPGPANQVNLLTHPSREQVDRNPIDGKRGEDCVEEYQTTKIAAWLSNK
jgi:hypothetical protein